MSESTSTKILPTGVLFVSSRSKKVAGGTAEAEELAAPKDRLMSGAALELESISVTILSSISTNYFWNFRLKAASVSCPKMLEV